MNANQILAWVKANLLIVIFSAIILAAFVALPLIASSMNGKVRSTLQQRKQKYEELRGVENRTVQLGLAGGREVSVQGLITQRHVDEAKTFVDAVVSDAEQTFDWALAHNRKQRQPLISGVFPEMQIHQVAVKTEELHRAVMNAYRRLLTDIRAGSPPQLGDLRDDLFRRERMWRIERGLGEAGRELTSEQQKELRETLGLTRIAKYSEIADTIRLYAALETLNPPEWALGQRQPSPMELFYWQWDFWVIEDVLLALNEANQSSTTVQDSAVKRIVSMAITEQRPRSSGGGSGPELPFGGGGGGPGLVGGGGGGGGVGGGGASPPPSGGGETPASGGDRVDPVREVPRDYNASMSGRRTNHLYDVRPVQLSIIVDTGSIPAVLDAIGRRNFMTITDLEVTPADAHRALDRGYVYGVGSVSRLDLTIETVWLRPWTAPLMPEELKSALKIAPDAPAAPQG